MKNLIKYIRNKFINYVFKNIILLKISNVRLLIWIWFLYHASPTVKWILLQSLPLSPSRDTSPVHFGGRFLDDDMLMYGERNNLGSYFGGTSNDLRRDDFQEGKHRSLMDHKRMSDANRSYTDIHHNDQWENRRTSFPADPGYHNYLRVWDNYTYIHIHTHAHTHTHIHKKLISPLHIYWYICCHCLYYCQYLLNHTDLNYRIKSSTCSTF
jgi:hypothetical protein